MIIDGFDVNFQQIEPFAFIIQIVTPDGNKFISPPVQCNGMNETMAYQVWSDANHRKNFFLELEVKKEYI
jgi:hypothetical protein